MLVVCVATGHELTNYTADWVIESRVALLAEVIPPTHTANIFSQIYSFTHACYFSFQTHVSLISEPKETGF